MVLSQLANILRSAFAAKPTAAGPVGAEPCDSVLFRILPRVLGNTAEALSRATIVRHCAEVAKAAAGENEIAPAEFVSTMLGYFMMLTLPSGKSGLLYLGESHPLAGLAKQNRGVVTIDARPGSLDDPRLGENIFGNAIVILKDANMEKEFCERGVPRLAAQIAAIGGDVLLNAASAQTADTLANAICGGRQYRRFDFRAIQSGLGLSAISLRCV